MKFRAKLLLTIKTKDLVVRAETYEEAVKEVRRALNSGRHVDEHGTTEGGKHEKE